LIAIGNLDGRRSSLAALYLLALGLVVTTGLACQQKKEAAPAEAEKSGVAEHTETAGSAATEAAGGNAGEMASGAQSTAEKPATGMGNGTEGQASAPASSPSGAAATTAAEGAKVTTTASGLKYQDLVVGTGTTPKVGQTCSVHYTGWLTNGTKFDSSRDRGQPFTFPIGQGHVIKGWDEGVMGMKVGGKRKLMVPPDLAYGAQGYPPVIPPNSELVFEVELLGVQ
jgi:peptidylprolyl isomerase